MTRPRPDSPTIPELREAAKRHVEARGVRAVAKEIDISCGALQAFIDGATPYLRTAEALREWFESVGSERDPEQVVRRHAATLPVLAGIREEELRTVLRRAVEESTMPAVAEQVGISRVALSRYLEGTTHPREGTLRLYRDWYLREADRWKGPSAVVAASCLSVLLEGLPESEFNTGQRVLVGAVRGVFEHAKATPPRWISAIREVLDSADTETLLPNSLDK